MSTTIQGNIDKTDDNDNGHNILADTDYVIVNPNIHVIANGANASGIHSNFAVNSVILGENSIVSSVQAHGIYLNGTINEVGLHTINIGVGANVTGKLSGITMAGSRDALVNKGHISADTGVLIGGGYASYGHRIENYQTITGTNGFGLHLQGSGTIYNTGTIQGTTNGIQLTALQGHVTESATINNYGVIAGAGSAINVGYQGLLNSVTVNNFGLIQGDVAFNDGADVYIGISGSVTGIIYLGGSNDRAHGGAGDETFVPSFGNDTIYGGGGNDLVIYEGARSNFTITSNGDGSFTVNDSRLSEGIDLLKNVRFLQFDDQRVTLINAAPANIALSKISFAEDLRADTIVADLSAFDADGDAVSYALTNNAGGAFRLDGNHLLLARSLDYETGPRQFTISIEAKDAYGKTTSQSFTLDLTNVVETNPLTLTGTAGTDTLVGENGHDKFTGNAGRDLLTGGAGQDVFVFDRLGRTNAAHKRAELDTITDFNRTDDTIWLQKSVFKAISKKGVLASSAFYAGTKAHDASDRVIYDKKSGAVWYDADGTGSKAAIQIATLQNKPATLTAADFFLF